MAQNQSCRFEFTNEDGSTVPAHLHKNPNGDIGGWVADTAIIGEGAIIEAGAVVGPKAVINSGEFIKEGQLITS